jgi:hypothetical protein
VQSLDAYSDNGPLFRGLWRPPLGSPGVSQQLTTLRLHSGGGAQQMTPACWCYRLMLLLLVLLSACCCCHLCLLVLVSGMPAATEQLN